MTWFYSLVAVLLGFIATWLAIEIWIMLHPQQPLREADVEESAHPNGNVHVLREEDDRDHGR